MDTKLRSIKYHILLKTMAFVLIAGALAVSFGQVLTLGLKSIPIESVIEPLYKNSRVFMTGDANDAVFSATRAIAKNSNSHLGSNYYLYYESTEQSISNIPAALKLQI